MASPPAGYSDVLEWVIVNNGVVGASAGDGFSLAVAGEVVNLSGASISSTTDGVSIGAISGTGSSTGSGATGGTGTSTGSGTVGVLGNGDASVINAAGATISGTTDGVSLAASGTVTVENAGTITGGTDAVSLAAGTNRLIVDAGAVFNGAVVASATAANTLELSAKAGAGSLSGLGSQYQGFQTLTIDSGATWTLTGTNTLAAGSVLANSGTLTLSAGTLAAASLTGTGTVTIGHDGTLAVTGAIAAGTIAGLVAGDTIDLTGVTHSDTGQANLLAGNTLEIIDGGGTFDLVLLSSDNFAGASFHLAADAGTGTAVTETTIACFLHGRRIRTPFCDVAAERLKAGDLVVTARGEQAPIAWVGHHRVAAPGIDETPIRLRADSFGPGLPAQDLFLSPEHCLFLDGVLVPVRHLVNGSSIAPIDVTDITYFHIVLDRHDVILAEGLPTESLLYTTAVSASSTTRRRRRCCLRICSPVRRGSRRACTSNASVTGFWRVIANARTRQAAIEGPASPDREILVDHVP